MNTEKSLRLSAARAVLLILYQAPMFAVQASADRAQTTTFPEKSPYSSEAAKPWSLPRPERTQNSVTFTAVPAQDTHARHREDFAAADRCLSNPYDYAPVATNAPASPQQAPGPSPEILPSAPRMDEHTDDRVQAMPRIGDH